MSCNGTACQSSIYTTYMSHFFRPAYMDEYEKLEEELKKVYEVIIELLILGHSSFL